MRWRRWPSGSCKDVDGRDKPGHDGHWGSEPQSSLTRLVKPSRPEADVEPEAGALREGIVVGDVSAVDDAVGLAVAVVVVHLRRIGVPLILAEQRQAGARAELLARLELHPADEGDLVVRQAELAAADSPADEVAVVVGIGAIDAGVQIDERAQAPAPVERREKRILAADHDITPVIGGIERLFVVEELAHAASAALDVKVLVKSTHVEGRAPMRAH